MKLRLARYAALMQATPPLELEALVRGGLIQYFFHVSDKHIVEVLPGPAGVGAASRQLNLLSPTLFKGRGHIRLAHNTLFGWPQSPHSYRCSHIEARNPGAVIDIGEACTLNNGAVLLAEGAGIRIGARCLIGTEFQVMDTNAHELALGQRHRADSQTQAVWIGDDVFIGSRVTLLKGCQLGNGCVVAAGSVLQPGFTAPALSIVAGNPARVVGEVKGEVKAAVAVQPTLEPA